MRKFIDISDEAFDLLKRIGNGAAEYRDTEYNNVEEFMKSDIYKNNIRTIDWFLDRNFSGTYHLIPELSKYNLVEIDSMCWHITFVITELGKEILSSTVLDEETEDYYECPRCKINSNNDQMCPCPRGGCEAIIAGSITTTRTFKDTLTPEQIEWNKNR